MHMSSGASNFISDSHASRYNFGTLEGMLRSVTNPHFSRSREKCAQGADPAAAGSGLAAKAFAPAGRFPSGLPRVDFSQSQKFVWIRPANDHNDLRFCDL